MGKIIALSIIEIDLVNVEMRSQFVIRGIKGT